MKLAINHSAYYTAAASAALIFGSGWGNNNCYVSAQEIGNISGSHTINAGEHNADCTGFGCLFGNDWGNNGKR